MLQYTQHLFEHDRIRKQAKLILIRLLFFLLKRLNVRINKGYRKLELSRHFVQPQNIF